MSVLDQIGATVPEPVADDVELCGACGRECVDLLDVFSHDCPALQRGRIPQSRAGAGMCNVDRPEGRTGASRSTPAPQYRTNGHPGPCAFCGVRIPAGEGRLVRSPAGRWSVEHPGGPESCPAHGRPEPLPPVETPAPAGRPNRFPGTCSRCRVEVPEGAGTCSKVDGRWIVTHAAPCAPLPAAEPVSLPDVPEGHYAIESGGENDLAFYRVDRPADGPYAGRTFVKMVVGGHPDRNVPRAQLAGILARIVEAGVTEAAALYGREIGRCYRCNRHLTDETSRALGIGPECRRQVGG